jgi:hypothetical protein
MLAVATTNLRFSTYITGLRDENIDNLHGTERFGVTGNELSFQTSFPHRKMNIKKKTERVQKIGT